MRQHEENVRQGEERRQEKAKLREKISEERKKRRDEQQLKTEESRQGPNSIETYFGLSFCSNNGLRFLFESVTLIPIRSCIYIFGAFYDRLKGQLCSCLVPEQ